MTDAYERLAQISLLCLSHAAPSIKHMAIGKYLASLDGRTGKTREETMNCVMSITDWEWSRVRTELRRYSSPGWVRELDTLRAFR